MYNSTARVICDILIVKSRLAEMSVLSATDVDCIVDYLYVSLAKRLLDTFYYFHLLFSLSCVLCTIFIDINNNHNNNVSA